MLSLRRLRDRLIGLVHKYVNFFVANKAKIKSLLLFWPLIISLLCVLFPRNLEFVLLQ
jgi:uncharacterized protein YPO0396